MRLRNAGIVGWILCLVAMAPAFPEHGADLLLQPRMDQIDRGVQKDLQAQGLSQPDIEKKIQEMVAARIEKRLVVAGVADAVVERRAAGKILVHFSDERDLQRCRGLLTRRGSVRFYSMLPSEEADRTFAAIGKDARFKSIFEECLIPPVYPGGPYRVSTGNIFKVKAVMEEIKKDPDLIGERNTLLLSRPPHKNERQEYSLFLVRSNPVMTGEEIVDAKAMRDQDTGRASLFFTLSEAGKERVGHHTETNVGKVFPIAADDTVLSWGVIQSRMAEDIQIDNVAEQEAREIAIALNAGPFPAPVVEVR